MLSVKHRIKVLETNMSRGMTEAIGIDTAPHGKQPGVDYVRTVIPLLCSSVRVVSRREKLSKEIGRWVASRHRELRNETCPCR